MAANFARFASRGISSSIRSTPRLCTREAARISEHISLVRRCRSLASVQGLQSAQSNNLVQLASKKFSNYTPITVTNVSTIISNHLSGSSEALEESSTECDDEATNGRKRIKPHELQRDDP